MRLAVGCGGEQLEQLAVVQRVLFLARARLASGLTGPGFVGESRRTHAGRATEGVNTNARVIGQRRQAGDAAGVMRLGQRVFDKGEIRLLGFAHPQRALRDDLDIERREDGADLVQLTQIIRRDDDFFHDEKSFPEITREAVSADKRIDCRVFMPEPMSIPGALRDAFEFQTASAARCATIN